MAGFIPKPLAMMTVLDLEDVYASQRRILRHTRCATVRAHVATVMQAIEAELLARTCKLVRPH